MDRRGRAVAILFDGGMHIGWAGSGPRRYPFSSSVRSVPSPPTGGIAVLAHSVFGLDWTTSKALGTALSPIDPAVIFSVLGRRAIVGRTGTILEGESGANDPVGIALMVGVLEVAAGDSTILQPGDEILTLADPEREQDRSELFSQPNGHLDQTSRPDLR